jgi:hypothetical protein
LYHTTSKKRLHTKLKKPNWKHSNLWPLPHYFLLN